MNWVYNTATGTWGIMTPTGFIPMPGTTGPYAGGDQVNIPPGGDENADIGSNPIVSTSPFGDIQANTT